MQPATVAQQMECWIEAPRVVHYPRNSVLFVQDQPAESLWILEQGLVKLSWLGRKGTEKTLQYVVPGSVFGVVSLLEDRIYGVMATTALSSHVVQVPRCEALRRVRTDPDFAVSLTVALADKVRCTSRQAMRFSMHSRVRKVVSGLLDLIEERGETVDFNASLLLRVTHQELADFAGTNRVTVTSVLGFLEGEGLVEKHPKAILVPDPQALLHWPARVEAPGRAGAPV